MTKGQEINNEAKQERGDIIEKLWPLSSGFEYASEVGLSLRMLRPSWWSAFENEIIAQPLAQVQGMNFMAWVESRDDLPERDRYIKAALLLCAPRVLREVEAELACRGKNWDEIPESDPLPELDGQTIHLYAPLECKGYPDNKTSWLDQWTLKALRGAEVIEQASEAVAIERLWRVHYPDYVRGIFAQAERGGGVLTPETVVTEKSPAAICASAGALCQAAVDGDKSWLSLALVRPGSHHGEKGRGGGTCLINNMAVCAGEAIENDRGPVAILDIDAHHGNGSESIFRENGSCLTVSVHQEEPFFPGTGQSREMGRGAGAGTNLNLPMNPSSSWRDKVDQGLVAVERFHPKLILVEFSADAHRADPTSSLQARDDDYCHLGRRLALMNTKVVFELGSSLSERAWIGAIRSLVIGWEKGIKERALR